MRAKPVYSYSPILARCFIAVQILLIPFAVARAQICPQCFAPSQFAPFGGHGIGANGGRIINVCFNSTAQVDNNGNPTPGTTNPNFYNALGAPGSPNQNGAIQDWNNGTANGSHSGYYLQYNCTSPDVYIGYAPHTQVGGAGCGQETPEFTGNQITSATIQLSDWTAQSVASQDIVGVIAHEIGHVFGLDDSEGCGATIMEGVTSYGTGRRCSASGLNDPVMTNDVAAAQAVINHSPSCEAPVAGGGGDPCACSGSIQCPNSYGICSQSTGCVWQCANSEPGCLGSEPGPCCDDCYEVCDAGGWTCIGSPITLDTMGEGFHFTNMGDGVKFRVQPLGVLHQMSWPDQRFRNGWLALDRDGDGQITSFKELFGSATAQPPSPNPNGYLALAVFDDPANGGNGNGLIDPGDSVFSHLLLWIDDNHNGVSEPSELHGLAEMGIFSIDLRYSLARYVDQNGNIFRYKSSVSDGRNEADSVCYDVFVTMQ